MTTELLKQLALMQHLGKSFFILNDVAYEGTEKEAKGLFVDSDETNFEDFCGNELTEVEEYDENSNDYLVLTDDEADEKWEESLDSYIDECILPETPKSFRNYFDDEKWKSDARHDGRGHSLASYDGNEDDETIQGETFYIYRIN